MSKPDSFWKSELNGFFTFLRESFLQKRAGPVLAHSPFPGRLRQLRCNHTIISFGGQQIISIIIASSAREMLRKAGQTLAAPMKAPNS